MILFIKHIDIEGPATLGEYFSRQGLTSKTIDLGRGDTLPADINNIDAVISLGGPMNVYEEKKYPFLTAENVFIQKILEKEIPFMGICLGSQLLAKACGAKVEKSPQKEIGFFDIRLTREAQKDPLFVGTNETIEAFHWHEDMSILPQGATLFASSKGCPHQAFKVGPCAYGLQFHVEITDISIREWCDKYVKTHYEKISMKDDMLKRYKEKRIAFDQTAEIIYHNFLAIINQRKKLIKQC